MKAQELLEWFENHVEIDGEPFSITAEQAEVVLDEHKNTLVTARAGSGKTRTIVAKIVYLICQLGINPSEIIVFAFNREARNEINDRLSKITVDFEPLFPSGEVKIATTFHSFGVRSLPGAHREILSDEKIDNKEMQGGVPDRTFFIQKIITDRLDVRKVYDFVRTNGETDLGDGKGTSSSLVDEYDEVRNRWYETLDGELVKSHAEKIIADYFFEHGIEYVYEKKPSLYPQQLAKYAKNEDDRIRLEARNVVKPDFYLPEYKLLWEHWGISGNESKDQIEQINKEKVFGGGYNEYKANKEWKEWFYERDWLDEEKYNSRTIDEDYYLRSLLSFDDLITTYKEPSLTRAEFEEKIQEILESKGIFADKLPDDVLHERFLKASQTVAHLTEQITGFIDKAEHNFLGEYGKLGELCLNCPVNGRVKTFYEFAMQALEYYDAELTSDVAEAKKRPVLDKYFVTKFNTDYNIVLYNAANLITEKRQNSMLKVEGYQYVFVDEYQDFSKLFYGLVKALLTRSPEAKIMVVGDDWQAINGYAGSSLEYFQNFEDYFEEDCQRLSLLTNKRSTPEIVEASNTFMKNAGILGEGGGVDYGNSIDEESLSICALGQIKKKKNERSKRTYKEQICDYTIMDIILKNLGKNICILSRKNTNETCGPIVWYKEWLEKILKGYDAKYMTHVAEEMLGKIKVSTVNAAKGLEADIVIIVESDAGKFAIKHPDTELYAVFGEDEDAMLLEQKKLFYVALTRPKEKLYIFHENDTGNGEDEYNFLAKLDLTEFSEYEPRRDALYKRLQDEEIKTFLAESLDFVPRENKNINIVAISVDGEKVTQYNASEYYDKRSLEDMKLIKEKLSSGELKKARIWVDVRDSKWLHFYATEEHS